MRITEKEKTKFSKFRDVSELRIQSICEYRLYLRHHLGIESTEASLVGKQLHSKFENESISRVSQKPILTLIIIVLTVVIGLLWILW